MSNKQKIAICLFGIIRNSEKCIPSFYKNIIEPLEEEYDVSVYFHIYKLEEIKSGRSNENSKISRSAYDFLNAFEGILEKSTKIDENYADFIFSKGDPFFNNFHSCKNLLRQLSSVNKVYNVAKKDKPLVYLFMRPDLEYSDKIDTSTVQTCIQNKSKIIIPYWQWWGGMNDRFAICGSLAATTYASRYYRLSEYCFGKNNMLHGEKLVKYVIQKDKLSLGVTNMKAHRVRVNGEWVEESFSLSIDVPRQTSQGKVSFLFLKIRSILGKIRDGNLLLLFWRYLLDIKLNKNLKIVPSKSS